MEPWHIAGCKQTGHIRFEKVWFAIERPIFDARPVAAQPHSGQQVAAFIALDSRPGGPIGARNSSNAYEQPSRRNGLPFGSEQIRACP